MIDGLKNCMKEDDANFQPGGSGYNAPFVGRSMHKRRSKMNHAFLRKRYQEKDYDKDEDLVGYPDDEKDNYFEL